MRMRAPCIEGSAGALSHSSRSLSSAAMARGSASLYLLMSSLNFFIGSHPLGTRANHDTSSNGAGLCVAPFCFGVATGKRSPTRYPASLADAVFAAAGALSPATDGKTKVTMPYMRADTASDATISVRFMMFPIALASNRRPATVYKRDNPESGRRAGQYR